MQLYRLLPAIVRERDRLGSGVTDELSEETVLQKIFYAIEQEGGTTEQLTEGLRELLDPASCPVLYLPLLEFLLGSRWPAIWPESRRRLAIASVVKLYHHSGQRLSWVGVLNLLDNVGFFPWELWKESIYETTHYSRYGGGVDGYYGLYHAARVDLTDGTTDLALTEAQWDLIEIFRPIHVLLRRQGLAIDDIDPDSAVDLDSDVVVGTPTLGVTEMLSEADDLMSMTIICVATCESACEGACETSIEPPPPPPPSPTNIVVVLPVAGTSELHIITIQGIDQGPA